jgi:toxin ParE1/3/4
MNHALTEAAVQDIRDILHEILPRGGARELMTYQQIITSGIEMVADSPDRSGSIDRADIAPGLRMWHLALTAGRRGAAAHCLYYRLGRLSDGATGAVILRVLHQRVELSREMLRPLIEMDLTHLRELMRGRPSARL